MKINKSQIFFITITLILSSFIVYLGIRTVKHEALLRHYQTENYAQSQISQVTTSIQGLLNERASHLETLTNYIQFDNESIQQLLNNEINIKNIFILDNNQHFIYPDTDAMLSQANQHWINIITPIMYDNSILYSHYLNSENADPTSGWFMSYDSNEPILIYWIKKEQQIIGFQITYIKLILDMINLFDSQQIDFTFTIDANNQVIYDYGDNKLIENQQILLSRNLFYPLQNWQINYFAEESPLLYLYILGGGFISLLLLALILAVLYAYREYTRTLRLARQQVNFVGQVSHEFKTPLTNITLYSEMLQEYFIDEPEPIPHYLDVITSESQRLTRLVQNVLNFTKAPKVHLRKQSINQLIQQIYETFQPVLATKNIMLNYQPLDKDNDEICTDGDRVIQIVSNFLSNAEKYASEGMYVDLIIEQKTQHILAITVRDYGQGISESLIKHIFKPFYRIHNTLTEGVSGTGIGLTIAKQLAESINGKILVENKTSGVAFSLLLPIDASH